ncbi:hypothetical protein ACFFRR_005194 [Megaselia abdita]
MPRPKTRRPTPVPTTILPEFYSPNRPPPEPPKFPTKCDIIGKVLGDFGIWQLRTALIIFLVKIPAAWFMACIIFTAPELYAGSEFYCDADDSFNISRNQCVMTNTSNAHEESCNEFKYDSQFYSLIMQFNLVCDRDILIAWTQFWHLFGILVGGVLGTKMMLWISPKNVMLIGMVAQIGCGVVTGYIPDFSLHCFFRCSSAVCCALMMTAGQTIFTEITGGNYRIGLVTLYDTFWSIGLFFLPTLSSFFTSWGQIYLGISLPTIVLIISLIWIPEAPRWLIKNKNDIAAVEKILLEAAVINDRLYFVPENLREELQLHADSVSKLPSPANWLDLWEGPRAKTHFIASHLALAFYIINFMGMLLNTRSFGRDYLAVNTIVTGVSEVIGCFLALYFTLKYNKWKWQYSGAFNVLAGILGCSGWLFPNSCKFLNQKKTITLTFIYNISDKSRTSYIMDGDFFNWKGGCIVRTINVISMSS